jgi:hypothetical protein
MSGGGGGSGNDSGNQQAAAKQAMTTQAAYTSSASPATSPSPEFSGGGGQGNEAAKQAALTTYHSNLEDYDAPDKDHYNQTQKEITEAITGKKGLGDDYQADWSDLSKGQQEQYQLEMNKVKGTKDKNYSFYAGNEGTINNTFAENWKDAVVTSPSLSKSPTLRFLMASAKTVKQNATTSYGTGDYGAGELSGGGSGTAVDKGGWLGKISSGQASKDFIGTPQGREAMNEIAPHAPYMISGITKPTDSPAANWYANLGKSNTNPGGFNLATEYATAKAAISTKLQSRGPIGMLAVSDSPYYDWLKTNKLDKGIL